MNTSSKSPIEIAHDVINEITNCMYDLAEGDEIKADRMFDDPNVMSDMLGDRILDHCGGNWHDDDTQILIWETSDEILKLAHPALKKATIEFKERHELV